MSETVEIFQTDDEYKVLVDGKLIGILIQDDDCEYRFHPRLGLGAQSGRVLKIILEKLDELNLY